MAFTTQVLPVPHFAPLKRDPQQSLQSSQPKD
jgi:hypothetical protein